MKQHQKKFFVEKFYHQNDRTIWLKYFILMGILTWILIPTQGDADIIEGKKQRNDQETFHVYQNVAQNRQTLLLASDNLVQTHSLSSQQQGNGNTQIQLIQMQQCMEYEKKMNDAEKDLIEMCKKVGKMNKETSVDEDQSDSVFSSCKEKIELCSSFNVSEPEIDVGTQMLKIFNPYLEIPVTAYNKECKPLSQKKRDQLEENKETLESKITELQKNAINLKKETEDLKRNIEEEILRFNREARNSDLEEKKRERKETSEKQNRLISYQKQIRDLQSHIQKDQSAIAKAISDRARMMSELSSVLRQRNCLEKIKESPLLSTNQRSKIRSANSLIAKSSSRKKTLEDEFKLCMKSVQEERNAKLVDFQNIINNHEDSINSKEQEIKNLQSAMQLLMQQESQILAEREQNKNQELQERMQKMQMLYAKLQSLNQDFFYKTKQNEEEMKKLRQKLRDVEVDLITMDDRPVERIKSQEFQVRYDRYLEYKNIVNQCRKENLYLDTTPDSTDRFNNDSAK